MLPVTPDRTRSPGRAGTAEHLVFAFRSNRCRSESTLFAPRERAALAWAEVLTKLPARGAAFGLDNGNLN